MSLHRKPRLRSIDSYTLPLFPWLVPTKCQSARAPAPTPRPKGKARKAKAIKRDPILTIRRVKGQVGQGVPPEAVSAPVSVFNLATSMFQLRSKTAATPAPKAGKYASRMQPTKGVLRVEGAAYPARWTAEDHKREEQRRARQRPPRPTAKARTKSEKLIALLGVEEGK